LCFAPSIGLSLVTIHASWGLEIWLNVSLGTGKAFVLRSADLTAWSDQTRLHRTKKLVGWKLLRPAEC
jgi:hypothetical protein